MVQSGDCAARRPVRRVLRERGPNNFITARGRAMSRRVWVLVGVLLAVLTITVVARGQADKRQQWASSQHAKGNTGLITNPDGSPADVAYLTNLGLTRFSVRPQTCAVCHNADYTIRVTASTPVLPAGFRAIGVGLGAQCMVCHNTRNGAIAWNLPDPRRDTFPHTPAHAEARMGKNAFFVP